jgi:hypothetical protein
MVCYCHPEKHRRDTRESGNYTRGTQIYKGHPDQYTDYGHHGDTHRTESFKLPRGPFLVDVQGEHIFVVGQNDPVGLGRHVVHHC